MYYPLADFLHLISNRMYILHWCSNLLRKDFGILYEKFRDITNQVIIC